MPEEKAKKAAKKEEPKVKYLTTKDVAAIHKIKPAKLRRVLRSLSKFQDGTYTRYKWEEGDSFLADLGKHIEKFNAKEKERNAKRLAELKEKGKGKAAPKAKKEKEVEEEDAEEIV